MLLYLLLSHLFIGEFRFILVFAEIYGLPHFHKICRGQENEHLRVDIYAI